MIQDTITSKSAQRYYDLLGSRYDWVGFFESRAKTQALNLLDLEPGQTVLNAGCGTGKQHVDIHSAVMPDGYAVGLDLSFVMNRLTREQSGAPSVQGDVRFLPFADGAFDRIFTAYLLDLIPLSHIPSIVGEFWRVVRDGGCLVVITLTEGNSAPSRALVSLWKRIYSVAPLACGGCRPLQLYDLVRQAGFGQVMREVIVQFAVPSEILIAIR